MAVIARETYSVSKQAADVVKDPRQAIGYKSNIYVWMLKTIDNIRAPPVTIPTITGGSSCCFPCCYGSLEANVFSQEENPPIFLYPVLLFLLLRLSKYSNCF